MGFSRPDFVRYTDVTYDAYVDRITRQLDTEAEGYEAGRADVLEAYADLAPASFKTLDRIADYTPVDELPGAPRSHRGWL